MSVLEAKCIRKEFGTLVAVNDVSFQVEQGQVVGLIGPNGAGKTTLLRMLGTLLRPTAGSASAFGLDLASDYLEIRRRIGYLPDFFNLYSDLTLRECLEFFARAYRIPDDHVSSRVSMCLDYVELATKQDEFIRHLSRGMVQRLGVAALIVHDPDLLLLDEPASGLDPKARIQLRIILKRLAAEGKTILVSSHILTELADFCSHVAIMSEGRLVVYGSVEDIQRRLALTRKIVVTVLGDAAVAAEQAREFRGVRVTDVKSGILVAETAGGMEDIAQFNAFLVGRGVRVVGFAEEKTSLEDLFMQISGGGEQ